jgi:uncharacterized protein YbjQ (UPF0145 family)
MKIYMISAAVLACLLSSSQAFARDSVANYSIESALMSESAKVDQKIPLYFAGQTHPAVVKSFGEFATSKKTNAFGKSDETACRHVFMSALLELQERVRKEGGNGVINIRSNYRNVERASATEFTCGAGALVAGVALKGEVVTLKK